MSVPRGFLLFHPASKLLLLGVYLAICHFRWFIEGRVFHVYTDHKPSNFAISSGSTQPSPRQIRQLAFISEFTTDLRHVMGKNNAVADTFSRIQINATSYTEIDFRHKLMIMGPSA
jgi:hypothetical protein